MALLPGMAARAAADTSDQPAIADMVAATARRLGLQTEMPVTEHVKQHPIHLPEATLWVLGAVVAAIVLYALKDIVWRRPHDVGDPAMPQFHAAGGTTQHLARAERFAQQGQFVQAMHELLLEGFREIRERAGERVADSLTSREILRKTPLPEHGLACLRNMVTHVEWTYFGEHPATLADYHACRASFDMLRAALRQPTGA